MLSFKAPTFQYLEHGNLESDMAPMMLTVACCRAASNEMEDLQGRVVKFI